MGINDRENMRGEGEGAAEPHSKGVVAARVMIAVFSCVLIFFGLRAPLPLYLKLPLLAGLGLLIRHLWGIPRKFEGESQFRKGMVAEGGRDYALAIHHYEKAAIRLGRDPILTVRLLAAYDSCDRGNRAKDLIKTLDGEVFPPPVLEELEHLVSKYRSASFEKVKSGVRMNVGNN